MDDETEHLAQLPEYWRSAWAMLPEAGAALAAAIRGRLAGEPATLPVTTADEDDDAKHAATITRAAADTGVTGGVAVIPLRGVITPRPSILSIIFGGGGGLLGFRSALRQAVASDDVAAIILDVDSPGGAVDLVPETAAEIREARKTKPVIAVANTFAASAAYWLASQADELVVTPSGEVGSIGVFQIHQDLSEMAASEGVNITLISAGKYKTEGNRFEPLSEEALAAIQASIDDYYDLFVADIAKGRGATANAVRNGFGEGRMVTAKNAVAEGMADRVDTLEATIARVVRNPKRARRAEQELPAPSEGTPEPNSPALSADDEEAKAARQAYIDVMYAAGPQ